MFTRNIRLLVLLVGLTILVIIGILAGSKGGGNPIMKVANKTKQVISGDNEFGFDENTPGYENFSQLIQGCPSKDCIPSIDNPKFESVNDANQWLADDDIVFVLEHNNEVKAYAQRILNWHEIVNDKVGGDPIAITFCPLCGSSLAFDRRLEGEILEFGVSGKLHNNDLVMYDRNSQTLWQQITGEAIVGSMFGKKLKQVSMNGMRWGQFKDEFASAKVLSRDTGFSRNYDKSPYGGYQTDRSPLFPISGGVDQTIHPKTMVYGIEVEGQFKAYPEEKITEEKSIKDTVGKVDILISYNDGDITFKNTSTDQDLIATRLFWFAWKAFRPDTKLY